MVALLAFARVSVTILGNLCADTNLPSVVRGCGHPFDSCPVTGVRYGWIISKHKATSKSGGCIPGCLPVLKVNAPGGRI